jgi:uncharacterized repeat protein (TIGR03943 family)
MGAINMRRDVQAIILVLIGGAILRISLTDVYLNYVKQGMQPYLVASGCILVILGVLALIDIFRKHAKSEDEHGHHGPRSAWLLLLPVFAIFLIAPPALGAYSAQRNSTNGTQPSTTAPPLPAGDPVPVLVSSFVTRAVWDDGLTLVDRNVEMTGFVTPDPAGGWWLTRLAISCCAADAIVSKIKTLGTSDLPANTWVTVVGHWVPGGGTKSESAVPLVDITSLTEVAQPKNPYE